MTGENEEVEDIGEQFKNSSFTTKTHVISGDLELMTEVMSQAEIESRPKSVSVTATAPDAAVDEQVTAPPSSYSYAELLERVSIFIIKNNPNLVIDKKSWKLEAPHIRGKCLLCFARRWN
jgi:hypothetical protein